MKIKIAIICLGFFVVACSSANRYGCKSNRCVKNISIEKNQKTTFT